MPPRHPMLSRLLATPLISASSSPMHTTALALTMTVPARLCQVRSFARSGTRRPVSPSSVSSHPPPPRGSIPVLPILKYPHPKLRAHNNDITTFDADLSHKAQALFKSMYLLKGVGLAAPQAGINERLVVINAEGGRGKGQTQHELALVNPKILKRSPATDVDEESCLSIPLVYGDVERSLSIIVQYSTLAGEQRREEFQNYPARILQHELDHLDGVLFIDRMQQQQAEGGEGEGEGEGGEEGEGKGGQYQSRLQRYIEQYGDGGAP